MSDILNFWKINSQNDRTKIIASICFVDYVITLPLIKDNKDYQSLVIDLKPAIIATTEGDLNRRYKEEQAKIIGAKVIDVIKEIKNRSTTRLIELISDFSI